MYIITLDLGEVKPVVPFPEGPGGANRKRERKTIPESLDFVPEKTNGTTGPAALPQKKLSVRGDFLC